MTHLTHTQQLEETLDLLSHEKDPTLAEYLWELLYALIDDDYNTE